MRGWARIFLPIGTWLCAQRFFSTSLTDESWRYWSSVGKVTVLDVTIQLINHRKTIPLQQIDLRADKWPAWSHGQLEGRREWTIWRRRGKVVWLGPLPSVSCSLYRPHVRGDYPARCYTDRSVVLISLQHLNRVGKAPPDNHRFSQLEIFVMHCLSACFQQCIPWSGRFWWIIYETCLDICKGSYHRFPPSNIVWFKSQSMARVVAVTEMWRVPL